MKSSDNQENSPIMKYDLLLQHLRDRQSDNKLS